MFSVYVFHVVFPLDRRDLGLQSPYFMVVGSPGRVILWLLPPIFSWEGRLEGLGSLACIKTSKKITQGDGGSRYPG